jgi:hypothetical protein
MYIESALSARGIPEAMDVRALRARLEANAHSSKGVDDDGSNHEDGFGTDSRGGPGLRAGVGALVAGEFLLLVPKQS